MTVHKKILLVEDDHATRVGMSILLERAGYDVVATESVQQGRTVLEEALPDLEEALVSGHAHHHHGKHAPETPYVRESPKVGRNDPCPCGSGKKFKKCHGG